MGIFLFAIEARSNFNLIMAVFSRILARTFSTTRAVRSAGEGAHAGGGAMWKKLSIFVALPVIVLANINAFAPAPEGPEDPHAPPPFVAYEYLRIRTKKFPWGDGNHSLFHNSHLNALPDVYEHSDH